MLQNSLSFANYTPNFLNTGMDVHCGEIFSVKLLIPSLADQFASTVQYKTRGHYGEKGEELEIALYQLPEPSSLPSDLYLGNACGCASEENVTNISQRHVR